MEWGAVDHYFTRKRKPVILMKEIRALDTGKGCPQNALTISFEKIVPDEWEKKVKNIYPRERLSAENAAKIPCIQVLGTYKVCFER